VKSAVAAAVLVRRTFRAGVVAARLALKFNRGLTVVALHILYRFNSFE